MASLDFALTRQTLMKGAVQYVGTDLPVAIRLRYVGTGTVTSVTVTTGTNIVMVTSDGGTDTYAFGTYTTVGTLVDAINTDGIFEARVLDTVRSAATATQFVDGAITAGTIYTAANTAQTVYDVKVDTSAALYFATCLTFGRGFDINKLAAEHRVHLQEIKYPMDAGSFAANALKVYDRFKGVETLLYQGPATDNSATTESYAVGYGKVTVASGHEIVVQITATSTLADAATNYLRVVGQIE